MSLDLEALAWPFDRLGEATEAVARGVGLISARRSREIPSAPRAREDGAHARWLEATAAWLGVEAEPVLAPYADIPRFVRCAAPALVKVGQGDAARFLALVGGGKRSVTMLDTARVRRRVPVEALVRALRAPLEATVDTDLGPLLERIPARRRARARAAILRERLGSRLVEGSWLIRSRPGAGLAHLAARAHLTKLAGILVVAQVVEYALVIASWAAAAKGALQGRYDGGWLLAWLLLLGSLIPIRVLGAWAQSRFSIGAGMLLKTRLLVGALRLEPNAIRHQGVGQLLGRVIESSAVEALGVSGGLASALALVQVAMCCVLLAQGAGSSLHLVLFVALVSITVGIAVRHYVRRRSWTKARLALTHDLVERMVGHRTRVAQELRERWHDGEDQALEQYAESSRALDGTTLSLGLVPQLWLLLGVGALAPRLMYGSPDTTALAVALGGILLGQGALAALTTGATQVAAAAIGWDEARPLLRAAASAPAAPAPTAATAADGAAQPKARSALLQAEELRFRYRERGEPVLRGCSLRLGVGERVLLEGPSGGGKSTLAAILTGLRVPESGLLLLGGLDRSTLGVDGWRRRVAAAPQFHENHVFSSTFAFNVLMGRAWPPTQSDLDEAEAVCRELDLGGLLDRMPAGLFQMVGDTGWQLSHGEKSRLYIARALLQDADLIVLDESFAALDPETLQRALRCVLARSRTLLVVAHP